MYRLLVVGIGARAGADELWRIGQRPLRAIGIDAGADVEGARIEAAGNCIITAVAGGQCVEQIEAGARRRDLSRVDIAVHPERGLLARLAGREVRHCDHPDVSSLVAPADALDAHQLGIFLSEGVNQPRQVIVAIEAVECYLRHITLHLLLYAQPLVRHVQAVQAARFVRRLALCRLGMLSARPALPRLLWFPLSFPYLQLETLQWLRRFHHFRQHLPPLARRSPRLL